MDKVVDPEDSHKIVSFNKYQALAEDLEWDVQFKAKPYLDQACVNSPTNAVFESLQTHFRTRVETGYAVS